MSIFNCVDTVENVDTVAHYSQLCLHKLKLIYTLNLDTVAHYSLNMNVDTVAHYSQDTVENNELIIMGSFSVSDTVAHSS